MWANLPLYGNNSKIQNIHFDMQSRIWANSALILEIKVRCKTEWVNVHLYGNKSKMQNRHFVMQIRIEANSALILEIKVRIKTEFEWSDSSQRMSYISLD